MPRAKATSQNPYAGDPSPEVPHSSTALLDPGEHIVTLRGATLKNFSLLSTGMGFDVHFTIPLIENHKLPELTYALQRMVDVEVTRYDKDAHRAEQGSGDG